ncbi:conserved hypothetical protein [Echinococcus multilocularis]|uniref:ALMS motif domain-containing protein n=1 Tax=Echinococcus multilocularis TaxID=6211 RepID=A0A068YCE2_ECHMU|nr:conserved hypothetical protein [Echinococcus multilocularis]
MPTNKSTMAFPSDFIVNSISTKPRDERNFILQNKKDICSTRKPKKDSYCHSMKPMMKTFVEVSSSSGRTDLGNQLISTNSQYVNPIVELEQLLREQRMDLYQANDFEGGNLQGKTEQIASHCLQPQKNVHIPLSEPNVPLRPVKIINFKVLNKHYQTETKSQVTNCRPDSFLAQRCKDVRSSRSEIICYEAFKTTYGSMEGQPIDPTIQAKKKVLLNKKGFQNNPANADRERRKSKREIMLEYSKTVAAANLVRDKKGILEARQKFPSKHISALDVKLARILRTHEAETQRMASPFIT